MKRDGKFIKVMGIFLGLVLFLTFFSKTIYNFNLPTVTAVMPAGGILVDKVEKDALITYSNVSSIYAEIDGKVKNVLTAEGQDIKKDQTLIELYQDEEAIDGLKLQMQKKEQDIELLTIKLNTMQSDRQFELSLGRFENQAENENRKLQRLESEIETLESEITAIQNGSFRSPILYEHEHSIKIAQEDLHSAGILFEAGGTSLSDLKEAENKLESLKLQYEQYIQSETDDRLSQIKSRREQIYSSQDTLSGIEAERKKLEQENEDSAQYKSYEINDILFQISNAKTELAILERQLVKALNPVIVSDSDGIAMEVKAEKNQYINKNDMLMQLADGSNTFKAEIILAEEELELISAGSGIEIRVNGIQKTLTGEITSSAIYQDSGETKRRLTIGVNEPGYELAHRGALVILTTESEKYDVIVPNSAIRKDSKGYFVLTLKEEDNVFGKNFLANRVYVDVIDADNSLSSISGLTYIEPVIVSGTAPVEHGSRVKYEK